MASSSDKIQIQISKALTEAIEALKKYKGSSLTDIFFIVDRDSAELSIYDDEENLLTQRIIDAWIGLTEDDTISLQLRNVVSQFDMDDKFDVLDIYKPFSVNLADEDFQVIEELLLIEDESIIRIENDFMDRMDKEFDDFLDKLLKE